jgi:Ran GTPase-activating protein (RanGAP) involved in mRNA processing and transport
MTNINNLQFILNNSVNTLALRNISYISDFSIIELAKAINVNTNLTDLDLRYNNICVIELAKSISNNTTLTNIYLSYNNIGDVGAKELAKALTINKTLKYLNLSGNRITDNGVKELAKALTINTDLTNLNLSYNIISDVGVKELVKALTINKTLTNLDLGPNKSNYHNVIIRLLKKNINYLKYKKQIIEFTNITSLPHELHKIINDYILLEYEN